MHFSTIIFAAASSLIAAVSASPVAVKVLPAEHRMRGVQYMTHIQFEPSASASNTSNQPQAHMANNKQQPTKIINKATFALPPHTTPTPSGLINYGGPIIPIVEVDILTWGSAPNYLKNLETFYNAITRSPWFYVMRQYWTDSNNVIDHGWFKQTIPLTTSTPGFPTKTNLDDAADIQPFLKSLVANGVITPNTWNGFASYFAIHFPPGYTITLSGAKSCQQFCGYHSTVDISSLNVGVKYLYYGVIPDQDGNCKGGCGSNPDTMNNLFAVSSHELAEAVTDPAVGVAGALGYPLGWYNNANGEIGDLCNAQQDTTISVRDQKTYVIQKIWSNLDNACVAKSDNSP